MNRDYDFFVYMVSNYAETVLYTKIPNELHRRLWEHQSGEGSKFTKQYHVDRLVYFEHYDEALEAIAREKQIKGWTRVKKEALIRTMNPQREDLNQRIDEHWRKASEDKLVKPLEVRAKISGGPKGGWSFGSFHSLRMTEVNKGDQSR